MLIGIGWRNLWRNPRRTAITLVSIVFGIVLAVMFVSMTLGGTAQLVNSAARMGSGHVTIEPAGFRDNPSIELSVTSADRLAGRAAAMKGVIHASARITGQGLAQAASGSLGMAFTAIDPDAEKGVFILLKSLREGKVFSGTSRAEAIIGREMADQLGLRIHSKLVITTTGKSGDVVSGLVHVCGIFETGVTEADKSFVVLPIDWTRQLIGYAPGEANQVAILLDDYELSRQTALYLNSIIDTKNDEALAWYDTMPDLSATLNMSMKSKRLSIVFVFILIAAGILNTVLMSVLERFHEIGVMKAIGMKPLKVFSLVMSEAASLAAAGIALGCLVSVPLYMRLHSTGIDMSKLLKQKVSIGYALYDPVVRPELPALGFVIIMGVVMMIVLLSSVYPAVLGARIRPIKALQSE